MSQQRTPVSVPLAAGVVFALVVMILGGLFLARRVETPTTTPSIAAPAATTTSSSAQISAPTSQATAAPTVAAQVTPTAPLPTAAPRPTTVPAPTQPPPAQPTQTGPIATGQPETSASIALVNGTPQIFGAGTAVPTTRTLDWWNDFRPVPQGQAQEIEQAFNRFWNVRIQAQYDLNTEALPQVMAGAVLQREMDAIEKMRADNRAAESKVGHAIQLLHAGSDEAAVQDDYTLETTYVDAVTRAPLESTPAQTWPFAYRMRKSDGVWRVVDAVRLVNQ